MAGRLYAGGGGAGGAWLWSGGSGRAQVLAKQISSPSPFSPQPTAKLPPVPGPAGAVDPAVGAVAPSVKTALEWLRSASRARPGVRLRVLVTGSLYLVGDVLRHLGRGGGE